MATNSGQDYNPNCVCATQQRGSEMPFLQTTDLDSRAQVRPFTFLIFFWWWVQCCAAISQESAPWKLEYEVKLLFNTRIHRLKMK